MSAHPKSAGPLGTKAIHNTLRTVLGFGQDVAAPLSNTVKVQDTVLGFGQDIAAPLAIMIHDDNGLQSAYV